MELLIIIGIIVLIWAIGKISAYLQQRQIVKAVTARDERKTLDDAKKELDEAKRKFEELKKEREEEREAIEIIAAEKSKGFPWLARAYADYFHLQGLQEADHLEHKPHPAQVSADRVREIAGERRTIEEKLRIAQWIIIYYQKLFPFLEDVIGNLDDEILQKILSRNIEKPIKEVAEVGIDPVRIYLSYLPEEEYQKLSLIERNQLALDRYWKRKKSDWEIGRDYERYIGYLYEKDGYSVSYQGIIKGYEDLGRDLICTKDNETEIVQCKYWSQYKTIHEKHINQLLGTTVEYWIQSQNVKNLQIELLPEFLKHCGITAVFITSTKLSERAKLFGETLGVKIRENFPIQQYPSIKCNVSRKTGEKIYHLPFDQQYNRTLVEEERNECYVETVEKAERLGFRRAWRWRGPEQENETP